MHALRALIAVFFLLCSLRAEAQAQRDSCIGAHEAAQRARRSGQFLEAQRQLLQCAQAQCPRVVRNDCTTWASEVSASVPSLVWAVKGSRGEDLSSVRITANGSLLSESLDGRAIEVDPGVYNLHFEAAGHVAHDEIIRVHEGEKTRLVRVQLEPLVAPVVSTAQPPTPEPVVGEARSSAARGRDNERVWSATAITLGSAAIASGVAALAVGLWGKSEYDSVRGGCGRSHSCSDDDVNKGQRAYIAADVLAGVAAASAVAAVWVFVHDNREHHTALSALPSRAGARLSLTRAF